MAAAKVGPQGKVIAVDLLDMEPLPGVTFIRGDFTTDETLAELDAALGGRAVGPCPFGHGPQYLGGAFERCPENDLSQ